VRARLDPRARDRYRVAMPHADRSPTAADGQPPSGATPAVGRLAAAARRAIEAVRRALAVALRAPTEPPPVDVALEGGAGALELPGCASADDPREDAAGAAACAPASDPRGLRVLLVEDDGLVARAVGRMLERLGHEVTTCADGAEALARFREGPARFDLVLTDETLPGLRGDELAVALLALRPSLPVLICTGYSDRLDDEAARALGARALLLKPLDVSQLEEALRAALAPPDGG
jgi:CheY-like chemotaxis protein